MRQDKIFARILLIFSIANVAIAAPAVVRQRHLDVAKAASEKRAPPSGNGETPQTGDGETPQAGDSPPDSPPSRIPPPNSPSDDWEWFHRLSSKPEIPESSSAAENRINTQASGGPGSGDGAAGDSLPGSESHIPPPNSPSDAWVWSHDWSTPPSSPAAGGRITQAKAASSLDSAHWEEYHPLLPHPGFTPGWVAPQTDNFIESFERKVTLSMGALGLLGGTAAIAYGIHKLITHINNHPYVSLRPPADI